MFEMKRGWLAGLCMVAVAASSAPAQVECDYLDGHLHVVLLPGETIDSIHTTYGTTTVDSLDPSYLIQVPAGQDDLTVLNLLAGDARVFAAELAYFGDTPEARRQMVVGVTGEDIEAFAGQPFLGDINVDSLLDRGDGAGQIVAVIDTGVEDDHQVFTGTEFVDGYDFVDDDSDPYDEADGIDGDGDGITDAGAGHGTLVTSLIGVAAPKAAIMPLRVLNDEGRGLVFDVAKGIRHAVDHGADVVNLSLGLTCDSEVLAQEITAAAAAGLTMTAAAGNESAELPATRPANASEVLSVTSVDAADVKADFANWHISVDVTAPGVDLLGAYVNDSFARASGTSFSAPIAAGFAAVVRSIAPGLTKEQVDDLIREGVIDNLSLPGNLPYSGRLGTGRVDGAELWIALTGVVAVPIGVPIASDLRVQPNPLASGRALLIEPFGTGSILTGRVFDVGGRLVRTLVLAAERPRWDGLDGNGRPLAPGVYRLVLGGKSATVVVVR